MILGIDAFNLRAGGGVTHLVELLRAAKPHAHGFSKVLVWGGASTLANIDDRKWLQKIHEPVLDRGLPYRVLWQRFRTGKLARQAGCGVLFVPGGSDASGFKPLVTMSQNMLPFEWREMRRFGWSFYLLKFLLLRWTQSRSFRRAGGVIFLTQYARDAVLKVTGPLRGQAAVIPHGISPQFFLPPRPQFSLSGVEGKPPCRLIYVSIVDPYKHQWHVAEAVSQLRSAGLSVSLELVGPPARGMNRLQTTLQRVDPKGEFIAYRGAVPYASLPSFYKAADIGIFASSCENLPNILMEAMAAGLPLACSRLGPMPEVLGDAGVYFDPERPDDIARALRQLIDDPDLRARVAQAAFVSAQQYSWERCADATFDFLAGICRRHPSVEFLGKTNV